MMYSQSVFHIKFSKYVQWKDILLINSLKILFMCIEVLSLCTKIAQNKSII